MICHSSSKPFTIAAIPIWFTKAVLQYFEIFARHLPSSDSTSVCPSLSTTWSSSFFFRHSSCYYSFLSHWDCFCSCQNVEMTSQPSHDVHDVDGNVEGLQSHMNFCQVTHVISLAILPLLPLICTCTEQCGITPVNSTGIIWWTILHDAPWITISPVRGGWLGCADAVKMEALVDMTMDGNNARLYFWENSWSSATAMARSWRGCNPTA